MTTTETALPVPHSGRVLASGRIVDSEPPEEVTAELILDAVEARELTDQIKTGIEAVWHLVVRAYTERAWQTLGYNTWDSYCTREFGTCSLRLPREERTEVVSSLRDSGLSIRAIASATGLGRGTVERELSPVPNGTPDPEPLDADPIAPGGITDSTPGQTDRVAEALAKANAKAKAQTTPESETITGVDGKTYAKKGKPKADKAPSPQPEPKADAGAPVNLDDDDDEYRARFWLSAPSQARQTGIVESYIGYVEDIYMSSMDDCDSELSVDAEDLGDILEMMPADPTMERGQHWRPDPAAVAAYEDAKAAATLANRLAEVLPRVVELWELLAERAVGESVKLLPANVIDGVEQTDWRKLSAEQAFSQGLRKWDTYARCMFGLIPETDTIFNELTDQQAGEVEQVLTHLLSVLHQKRQAAAAEG